MCLFCTNHTTGATHGAKKITCQTLVKIDAKFADDLIFCNCPNLKYINIKFLNDDLRIVSCQNIESVEVNSMGIYIKDCKKLKTVKSTGKRIMYVDIKRCPLIEEFPLSGTIAIVNISNIWISCLVNTYESGFCSSNEHKHSNACVPEYATIARIQKAVRRRALIKSIKKSIPIIQELWPIILKYSF